MAPSTGAHVFTGIPRRENNTNNYEADVHMYKCEHPMQAVGGGKREN